MFAGIIGDVCGSVYEAHQWQEKDLELFMPLPLDLELVPPLFKNTKWVRKNYSWTDDTLCTLALYHAYIQGVDPVDSLVYYCKKYKNHSIGFGKNFEAWLDNPQPYGSFANGAIMRIGFIPYLNELSLTEKLRLGYAYTGISHNHSDSFMAVHEFITICHKISVMSDKSAVKQYLMDWLWDFSFHKSVDEMHEDKTFEMNALTTLQQSVRCVAEACSLEETLKNTFYVGGDSDTLACVAGNIASHVFHTPNDLLDKSLESLAQEEELYLLVRHFENVYWHNKA